jgi:hypothetical protein
MQTLLLALVGYLMLSANILSILTTLCVFVPLCQGLELGFSPPHQPYVALLHVR